MADTTYMSKDGISLLKRCMSKILFGSLIAANLSCKDDNDPVQAPYTIPPYLTCAYDRIQNKAIITATSSMKENIGYGPADLYREDDPVGHKISFQGHIDVDDRDVPVTYVLHDYNTGEVLRCSLE